jgi:Mn-dependent DtxR family transcriptional regulator
MHAPRRVREAKPDFLNSPTVSHYLHYLLTAIGVSEPVAHSDAEGIEHHVSDETLRAMRAFVADHWWSDSLESTG